MAPPLAVDHQFAVVVALGLQCLASHFSRLAYVNISH
jgi:hypothetical protein